MLKNREKKLKLTPLGFTLVELLAVIVILAIVLIIAVPGVLGIINKTKQKGYESQLKMIKEAAKNYMTSESNKVEWETQSDGSKSATITLTVLQDNGYLDKKLIDPRDKSEITCINTVVTKGVDNKLTYDTNDIGCPTPERCFTFEKSTGTITDFDDTCTKDVVIPKKISGVLVTAIKYNAFKSNKLTSVVLPDSVTSIGDSAFSFNKLVSIVIPNSVTSIGKNTFQNNQLTNVVIGDGVLTIGTEAFYDNKIANLKMGENITSIGKTAFTRNQLPDEQAFIYNRNSDGSENKKSLNSYGGAKRSAVVVPDGIERVEEGAFQATDLTSVTLPESILFIGKDAFAYNDLTDLVLPNKVTEIGERAFVNSQISHLIIPSSVMIIGQNAFYGHTSSIVIQGKSSLDEFTSLGRDWYNGYSGEVTITFEP